jgi:hypothetical protein
VIVIFCLPKALACTPREFDGRGLFERFNEFNEIAIVGHSGCEDVKMIRHYAIRVNAKFAFVRVAPELREQPRRQARIRSEFPPTEKAERHKIEALSAIPGCR